MKKFHPHFFPVLLPLVFFLASVTTAHAAISVVQSTTSTWDHGTTNPLTLTSFPSTPTAGNTIICVASGLYDTTSQTFSDNRGGTTASYVQAVYSRETNSNRAQSIYYRTNITTGSPFTVTLTNSGTNESNAVCYEVAGLDTSPLDQTGIQSPITNWGIGNSATVTAAGALSQTDEIVFSVVGGRTNAQFTGISLPTGYDAQITRLGTCDAGCYVNSPASVAYKIVSSTVAPSAVWATNNVGNSFTTYANAVIATFKGVASAPASAPSRIMRLFEGFKIQFISGRVIIQQKQ